MNGAVQPEPGADLDLPAAGRALRARQAAAGPRPTVRDAQARPPPPLAPNPGPRLPPDGPRVGGYACALCMPVCAVAARVRFVWPGPRRGPYWPYWPC